MCSFVSYRNKLRERERERERESIGTAPQMDLLNQYQGTVSIVYLWNVNDYEKT
jgi:hypothetical protein